MDLIGPFIEMSDNFVKIGHQLHEALEKVLYTMSSVTSFLLQRGFCLPEDIADEILEQESQEAIGGGGAGAGEAGENDVSEEFDKEDLEDPLEQDAGGNPNQKDKDKDEEDNAVDMEDGNMDGKIENAPGDEEAEGEDEDKEQLDDEMGELDEEDLADKMDEKAQL